MAQALGYRPLSLASLHGFSEIAWFLGFFGWKKQVHIILDIRKQDPVSASMWCSLTAERYTPSTLRCAEPMFPQCFQDLMG